MFVQNTMKEQTKEPQQQDVNDQIRCCQCQSCKLYLILIDYSHQLKTIVLNLLCNSCGSLQSLRFGVDNKINLQPQPKQNVGGSYLG